MSNIYLFTFLNLCIKFSHTFCLGNYLVVIVVSSNIIICNCKV